MDSLTSSVRLLQRVQGPLAGSFTTAFEFDQRFRLPGLSLTLHRIGPLPLQVTVLIHEQRDYKDKAKDLLYVRDTIEVFSESLEELQKLFQGGVVPKLHPRRVAELEAAADALFGKVDDTIREAAFSPNRLASVAARLCWNLISRGPNPYQNTAYSAARAPQRISAPAKNPFDTLNMEASRANEVPEELWPPGAAGLLPSRLMITIPITQKINTISMRSKKGIS